MSLVLSQLSSSVRHFSRTPPMAPQSPTFGSVIDIVITDCPVLCVADIDLYRFPSSF